VSVRRLDQVSCSTLKFSDSNSSNPRPLEGTNTTVAEQEHPPKSDFVAKGIASFPDNVWLNIIFYASGLHVLEQSELSELTYNFILVYTSKARRCLALVCKKFYVGASNF
jgi:hypothetical protein